MQRIDRFGIAMHAGNLPGYPASHGCVRLPRQFAAKLFQVTDVGTPVMIGA
jgi:lipoprotein-anchoring transpeptidase ErfK/SrfK